MGRRAVQGDRPSPRAEAFRVSAHPPSFTILSKAAFGSGMTLSRGGRFLFVANANSDTVSVIDTTKDEVVETIVMPKTTKVCIFSRSNA